MKGRILPCVAEIRASALLRPSGLRARRTPVRPCRTVSRHDVVAHSQRAAVGRRHAKGPAGRYFGGLSIAQFTVSKIRGRHVDLMQWLVLGMVVVLGAATLISQDSRFIMVKPSIVHFAVGAVMLRRGWMIRYLPPIARDNLPESVMVAAGYAWAALMFVPRS